MKEWIPLQSSVISAVAYSHTNLYVIFSSKATYVYHGVPPKVYQALLEAPSHGQYFNLHIRGKYQYNEL